MKRTIITILFLLICIRTIAFDFSRTSPTGQVLYYNIDEQTTTVIVTAPVSNTIGASYIGYEKPAGELIIPNIVEYNGVHYVVKAIENNAFSNCMNLKSVTISDSITIIGNEAFKGCSNLREVKIGTKLQKIGVSAFLSCRKLQKINLLFRFFSVFFSLFAIKRKDFLCFSDVPKEKDTPGLPLSVPP